MTQGSIGRRYARAFLEIAREQGNLDESLRELESLGQILAVSADLNFLMTDPSFDSGERKKALSIFAERLKLSPVTQNFIKLLIDRERMVFFPGILLAYREQADEALGRVRVTVKVEDPMGDEAKSQLAKILEKITRKKVLLEVKERSGILGGMIIQMNDTVLDGSVKSALLRMKEKMLEAPVL